MAGPAADTEHGNLAVSVALAVHVKPGEMTNHDLGLEMGYTTLMYGSFLDSYTENDEKPRGCEVFADLF